MLGILVWSVFSRGVHALNVDFFTKGPAFFGQASGGVAPALVGSLLLVGIATVMALPIGVLTAIFVSEFAPRRLGEQIRLWLDVLNGFPSIVIGIFVFALLVKTKLPVVGWGQHQSALAGGFALAIIMLPLVARATMEVLALVPNELREASYALGVSKWQTVLRVVLPTSLRRHPHRHDARDRASRRRDGAAALHLRACGAADRLEPDALGQLDPADDLPVLRVARRKPSTSRRGRSPSC